MVQHSQSVFSEKSSTFTLPTTIAAYLEGKCYELDGIGLSGSTVLTFEDCVLKIEAHTPAVDESVAVMRWMAAQLPVPQVIAHEVMDEKSFLLMSRIPGKMCCDEYYLERSGEMVRLMAEGLHQLWSTEPAGCPRQRALENDLAMARHRVANNRVDMEYFESDASEFGTPAALLAWMEAHQPEYDPVVSHGDYCLPNVLLQDGRIGGFIDLAHAGIADRYSDIADCYRSLTNNFNGTFGGKVYENFNPDTLFDHLHIALDREKLKYYMLLDVLLA